MPKANEQRVRRYCITWNGPWDGNRPPRILCLWARNKQEAIALHGKLFPVKGKPQCVRA